MLFFFFKQKTAYEMRISDWSSDVCSSDLGAGQETQGIGAAGRLGDAEGLQAQLTLGDARQIALLLRLASVPQQGAHGVHLRVAGGAVAAGLLDLLQNGADRGQRQAAAAVLFGNQRGDRAGTRLNSSP